MKQFIFITACIVMLFLSACQSGGTTSGTPNKASLLATIKANEDDLKANASGNFDVEKAKKALTAYEQFITAEPKDPQTSEFLFKAAEIYRSLRQFPKAIEAYQRIGTEFPNYDKAPHSLFLMGFCYENDLQQKDKAKELYQDFLKKYPNHELAASVQFSLSNIDKLPEQIIKEFEAKAKKEPATAPKGK